MALFNRRSLLRGQLLFGVFALLCLHTGIAGEKYPVRAIASALLPADAVVREKSVHFEVVNRKKTIETVHVAVTIFSKKEESQGVLDLWYDSFASIKELEGALYDESGNKIKDLDDENVNDRSAVNEASLHDDARCKTASLYHNVYPYTVEFTFEIVRSGSLEWPTWYAQVDKYPVEHTSLTVQAPQEYPLRFWCNRDSVRPAVHIDGSDSVYEWSAGMLPLLDDDIADGDIFDATVVVKIAPNDFQIGGRKGSMTSWKEFGGWHYGLYADRQTLSKDARAEIHRMTDTLGSVREKEMRLYEYLQSRTRYISIQLGIGGWQPFEAQFVHTHQYGDCKALSNYMCALLKEAGIPAYPVAIRSGSNRDPMVLNFPCNQFNHVIVCIPHTADTVWLECTSQSMPFGVLSARCESRNALMITPDGGVVVATPGSRAADNTQNETIYADVRRNGTVDIKAAIDFAGNQVIDVRGELIDLSPEEREKWILDRIHVPNISKLSAAMDGFGKRSHTLSITLNASLEKYASVSGNRLFVNPNILTRRTAIPPKQDHRKSPVRYPYQYSDRDSIIIRLPAGAQVETLPPSCDLHTSFGEFHARSVRVDSSSILHVRTLSLTKTKIPAVEYSDFRSFIADVVRSDKSHIILLFR